MIDIHPIVVHFPIALLTIYTAIQCVPPKITWRKLPLFTLNAFLLIIGSASLLIARQTGDLLEHTQGHSPLLDAHSTWATSATAIYGILTIIYLLLVLARTQQVYQQEWLRPYERYLKLSTRLFTSYAVTVVALIGFILLFITGALGGAIVYGPEVDPFVSIVYHWLIN